MSRTFLLEIGLEELPADWVVPARDALRERVTAHLEAHRLRHGEIRAYATPRRLAVLVDALAERGEDHVDVVRGPRRKAALAPDGSWTSAAIGFARARGVPLEALRFEGEGEEAPLVAQVTTPGRPAEDVLAELDAVILGLPFPKAMRWGNLDVRYGRPIRWLVALYGEAVVPLTVAGVQSGRRTFGHRSLGGPIDLPSADAYAAALEKGFVLADVEARRARIVAGIRAVEAAYGIRAADDPDLLDEVTSLVEYPTVFVGRFDPAYLELPEAVLVTTMRRHQRYFPAYGPDGRLRPYFIGVRNGTDEALEVVVRGNEKVLAARLADARFFYAADLARSIDAFNAKLAEIAFHAELGSMAEKKDRLVRLADALARRLQLPEADVRKIRRAAEIAKFDLATQMVYEFTELEGVVGEAYALRFGEDPDVARAIREHRRPLGQGDGPPEGTVGAVVGLADKLDTLVGFFGLGLIPSGSEDPFALRRAALGAIAILRAHRFPFDLRTLVDLARAAYGPRPVRTADGLAAPFPVDGEALGEALWAFFAPRIRAHMEEEGVRHDVAAAVTKDAGASIVRLFERAAALQALAATDGFKPAVEAFVRTANMARKAEREGLLAAEGAPAPADGGAADRPGAESPPASTGAAPYAFRASKDEEGVERTLRAAFSVLEAALRAGRFSAPAEQALAEAALRARAAFQGAADGAAELEALLLLVEPIDRFFTDVLVMADDADVRAARLTLVAAVDRLVGRFADFRQIAV
ncbi:MAG: glycine--tRNA ligase subunit beta [Hydrogenibacillus schlegelii]|nr:glycine--tRNA ligase subunit beta [Hydrogenibacillus schlegelii]